MSGVVSVRMLWRGKDQGTYRMPAVPRVGEIIVFSADAFKVETVMWFPDGGEDGGVVVSLTSRSPGLDHFNV